jgi:hypothetical protein
MVFACFLQYRNIIADSRKKATGKSKEGLEKNRKFAKKVLDKWHVPRYNKRVLFEPPV